MEPNRKDISKLFSVAGLVLHNTLIVPSYLKLFDRDIETPSKLMAKCLEKKDIRTALCGNDTGVVDQNN